MANRNIKSKKKSRVRNSRNHDDVNDYKKSQSRSKSKAKGYISLNPDDVDHDGDDDEEIDYESLNLPQVLSSDESQDEEDDGYDEDTYDDDDEEAEDEEGEEMRTNWGRKIENYYVTGSDDESLEEEDLADRIAEAKRIKDEIYDDLNDSDADFEKYEQNEEQVEDVPTFLDSLAVDLNESLKRQAEAQAFPKEFFDWTDADKQEFIKQEHPEFLALLGELKGVLDASNQQVLSLLNNPAVFKLCNKDGIEYLDLRNELMLLYVTYLCYYLLLKSHGISIVDHAVISRLLEIRTMLEKAKPIESRLAYQINILVGDVKEYGTENLAPRLDQLEVEQSSGPLYKVPNNLPILETDSYARHFKKLQRASGRPAPLEQRAEANGSYELSRAARVMKKILEREEIEMEAMKRYPMSKKERQEIRQFEREQRRINSGCSLDQLSSFASEALKGKGKSKKAAVSVGLNIAAQKMRQNILEAESKRLADSTFKPLNQPGTPIITRNRAEAPKKRMLESDDDVSRLQAEYKELKAQKKQKVPALQIKGPETLEGKREVGKNILKVRGLTRVRDKRQGNARVHNRMKFEMKQRKHDAMTQKNRTEDPNYVGETTGINVYTKKSHKL